MKALFFVDIVFILLFASSISAVLRLPTRTSSLVGLLILAYADIVLSAQILATFQLLDARLFGVIHALIAGIGLALWWYHGRPSLLQPSKFRWNELLSSWKQKPDLWLLAAGVTAVYGAGVFLILVVPPNNWDSMTYHLSRVGYWLQHGSFAPWNTHNLRQTTFPINAEIGLMWTIIFWGTDQLAGFIQWVAAITGIVIIFGLARFLGYSRASSVFAAFVWATFPEIVLQSTSTQNDLLASVFFAGMIYLFFVSFRFNHNGALLLSGLAMGLALGTKLTALMALPGLAVGALLLWYKAGRAGLRFLATWGSACLLGFLLFAAYLYGLNLVSYGAPLGPSSYVESSSIGYSGVNLTLLEANTLRYLYQAADVTGLPGPVQIAIQEVKAEAGSCIFDLLAIDPTLSDVTKAGAVFSFTRLRTHEDYAWFGPLGFFLLIPATLYCGGLSLWKRDEYRWTLAAVAFSLFLLLSASVTWSPWRGRYFVVATTACAPFLAVLYTTRSHLVPLRWMIVLIAILVMGTTVVLNEAKPLTDLSHIWELDRVGMQALNRPTIEPVLRMVEDVIPPDASVGIIVGGDDWDYPIFGDKLNRKVLPILPRPEILDSDWLAKQGIDYLLIKHDPGVPLPPASADLYLLDSIQAEGKEWHVLYRGDKNLSSWDASVRDALLSKDKVANALISVAPSLSGRVVISPQLQLPPWGIETYDSDSLLWLGHGETEGISGAFWASERQTIQAVFEVRPGPARSDSQRTVEVTLENAGGAQRARRQFDQATELTFIGELQPGRNDFKFLVLDQATTLKQPNGDTRPLLVLLRHVTVKPFSEP